MEHYSYIHVIMSRVFIMCITTSCYIAQLYLELHCNIIFVPLLLSKKKTHAGWGPINLRFDTPDWGYFMVIV